MKKELLEFITSDVALFDCSGDCPDEVSINEDLRTDKYCNNCFTDKILAIVAPGSKPKGV